ncbi:hypothetical protein SuUB36_19440 [Streptococcus uberis]
MNWKHAYLRKATDEELEFSGISPDLRVELQMWDGDLPELDEEVLIYQNGHYSIDCMTDVDGGLALYDNDFGFEKGMEFTQEVEIHSGRIVKNIESTYAHYEWDVAFSNLGG